MGKKSTNLTIAEEYQTPKYPKLYAKIGLCFSGFMRTFERCAPSINRFIIEPNLQHRIKMTIATWDLRGYGSCGAQRINQKVKTPLDIVKKHYACPQHLIAYSFQNSQIGLFPRKTHLMHKHYGMRNRATPQWFLIGKSFEMMDSLPPKLRPEILIRLRSDLKFATTIKFTQKNNQWIIHCLKKNITLTPNTIVLTKSLIHRKISNDMFALGLYQPMKIYFRIYYYIKDHYLNDLQAPIDGVPEEVMQFHLRKQNLNLIFISPKLFKVIRT